MTLTSSHPIKVNGTRLDTLAYNISVKDGWVSMAGLSGANVSVPGRHGEIWTPGKRRDVGRMVLSMWASNTDADGVQGADQYATVRSNLDEMLRLFDSTYGLLDVQQEISPSDIRQAQCEVKDAIDPTLLGRGAHSEFKVALSIPGVFWRALADVDFVSPTGIAAIATHLLPVLAGSTAPMEELWVVVDGPLTNPSVRDPVTGHTLQLERALTSTEQWAVNTSMWTSRVGTNIAFTDNGASVTAQTVARGPHLPRLFALSATPMPSAILEGTGAGTSTRLRIRGRKTYH